MYSQKGLQEMKLEIEIEKSTKAFEEILRNTDKTSETVYVFFEALYKTLDITSGKDWFEDATFDDILDCI